MALYELGLIKANSVHRMPFRASFYAPIILAALLALFNIGLFYTSYSLSSMANQDSARNSIGARNLRPPGKEGIFSA